MRHVTAARIIAILISLTLAGISSANMVTVFADDGSGFDPVTALPNSWNTTDLGWNIGGTVSDLANDPAYQGTQAALDMIAALGGANQVISLQLDPGDQKEIWLDPFEIIPMVGDPFDFTFHQSGFVAPELIGKKTGITMIFDNFEIAVDDQLWLWVDMSIIQTFLVPVPVLRLAHSDNGKSTFVFEGMFDLVEETVFIDLGSIHFHSGDLPTVINSSFTEMVPEPSTALLLGIGLVGLAVKRRRV